MDIKAVPGVIQSSSADVIIVNLFEGAHPGSTSATYQALNGAIWELVESDDCSLSSCVGGQRFRRQHHRHNRMCLR